MKNFLQPTLCFLLLMVVSHAAYSQTDIFIFDGGSLTDLNDWDLVGDPSTHPSSFTADNQIFNIRSSVTLDAEWDVQGTNSKVVVGDSSSAIGFTIPETIAFLAGTSNVSIDVSNNATLTITNNTVPKLGTLGATSTVIYNETVEDLGTGNGPNQIIADADYGNLTIRQQDPVKELQTSISVAGNLIFNNTEFTVTNLGTTLTLDGDLRLLQTVTLNNFGSNLSITHTGNTEQNFTSDNVITIPFNSFSSTKTDGFLTLGTNISLDVANDFTIFYTSGAAFNVTSSNSVTVGGTYTLEGDGANDIPGGTYENLTLNLSSGNGILQGDVTVNGPVAGNGKVTLTSGSMELGNNNLTIGSGGSIDGADESKYIITPDNSSAAKGFLILPITGGTFSSSVFFPIGTSSSFNPCFIKNSSSGTLNFSVKVFGDVLTSGNTGSTVAEIEDLVNQTWVVEPSGSSLNVRLELIWSTSNEGMSFDNSMVRMFKYDTDWQQIGEKAPNDLGGGFYSIDVSGITSFSEFSVGDAGATLPVTWLSFTGEEVQKGVAALEWKTASELNNEGFEVQKSLDGKNYETIGFVEGAGTTNEIQTYGYTDEHLQQNTYYRLKQIDFDGKFDYSRIIFVESSQHIAHPFSVYPNPVRNTTPVNLVYQLADPDKEQVLQLQLHDMRGSQLLSVNGTINELNEVLNARLVSMSEGVYILTLSDFATLTRVKILKQ